MGKKINPNQAIIAWSKTGGKCWYCGIQLDPTKNLTFDHFVPKSAGGNSTADNLVPCCAKCNASKGSRSVEDFRRSLALAGAGIPTFSSEQTAWLKDHGFEFPEIASYRFYFETL